MEFILENSTWIIIVLVILIMTLIGYIADKSDFVEKRKEKEKAKKEQVDNEKKNMKTKDQQEFAAEIGDGSDLIMKENNITYPVELDRPEWKIEIPVQENDEKEVVSEDENNPLDFSMDLPEITSENNNEINNDSLVIDDVNSENNSSETIDSINNNYDINAPLQSGVLNLDLYDKDSDVLENNNEETDVTKSLDENNENTKENEDKKDDIEMPLPEIDSLKEVNDEDIWKF